MAACSTNAWPSVLVKRGGAVLGPRKIIKAGWNDTFGQLLCRYEYCFCACFNNSKNRFCLSHCLDTSTYICTKYVIMSAVLCRYDETLATVEVQTVEISKDDKFSDSHKVSLDAPLMLLSQFNCQNVCFTLMLTLVLATAMPTSTASRDAFEVLTKTNQELRLPVAVTGPNLRGDQRVRDELLKVLDELGVGWSPSTVESTGEQLVRKLAATLWYLDCHHGSFLDQGIHIPPLFA